MLIGCRSASLHWREISRKYRYACLGSLADRRQEPRRLAVRVIYGGISNIRTVWAAMARMERKNQVSIPYVF